MEKQLLIVNVGTCQGLAIHLFRLSLFYTNVPTTMTTSEPLLSASTAAQHLGNTIATEAESRLGFLKKIRQEKFANVRPLSDFFDRHRISFTTSFPEITKRWK